MRPRIIVILLVASVLAPLASANQPPVAQAAVQTEAVLNEPVVFTDASQDPDGTIVSAVWTFTDGRSLTGAQVTKRFDYPGIHTIHLEVTDNAGARATTQIELLVRATLMQGRAFALSSSSGSHADTGDIATPYHTDTVESVGEVQQGQLRAAALDGDVKTFSDRAVARANVAVVHIPHPLGFFHITGVEAEAVKDCGQAWRFSDVGKIRLNDAPIVPPAVVGPNTRIDLPDGTTIVLNAQDEPTRDRIGVTAVRILLPGQAPIEIGHAEAGVSYCPYTS